MTRRQFAHLLAGFGAYLTLPGMARLHGQDRRMRVAVSAETLAGANINDARAAYRVWGEELQRGLGITRTDLVPDVFIPSEQMIQMIRAATIDCFVLTAWEYAKVADVLDTDWVLVEDYVADGLEYLLVVHNASSFKTIEDLRGSRFTVHHHRDTVLLSAWVSLLLASSGQGPMENFFSSTISRDNMTQVVLPVFFHRADAAGLTRRAFDVAAEMNPQLGRDLRILAVSPKLIPIVFCFRRGCRTEDVQQFKDAVVKFKTLTAGQQVLQIYQSSGFTPKHGSSMKPTLDLVRQYERLEARTRAAARKERF